MAFDAMRTLRLRTPFDDIVLVPRALASGAERQSAASPLAAMATLPMQLANGANLARLLQFATAHGLVPTRRPSVEEIAHVVQEALRTGRILVLQSPVRRVIRQVDAVEALGPQSAEEEDPELKWIAFEVVDKKGAPLKNQKFILTLPDGSTRDGTLDGDGKARMNRIPPGTCKFSLVDVDAKEWKAA